jgi:CIC family chloride channel protein
MGVTMLHEWGYIEKWMILSSIVGVVAGIGAIAFNALLSASTSFFLGYIVGWLPPQSGEGTAATYLAPVIFSGWQGLYLLPLVLGSAGLVVGVIIYKLAPEAEGHGTDAVISAFHRQNGRIRGRVPIVKMIASAITIGSGGSAGKEGPIALIGAGFASWLSKYLKLNNEDTRILAVCGMAAGIGAIFKAPLGAAIFAIEALYIRDFEVDAIMPALISSVVGYSVFSAAYGFAPLFATPQIQFTSIDSLPLFALLGIFNGAAAILFVKIFYATRSFFEHRGKIHAVIKPAIGGVLTGLMGIFLPQVIGAGYGWVQLVMVDSIGGAVLLVFGIAKMFATSFSIGSGGSGGVFAPSLVIGGMLGGAIASLFASTVPDIAPLTYSFVIVGMASFFAGAAKVPIAAMILVAELCGNYYLLIPAMIACSLSYAVSGRHTLYRSQVFNKKYSPSHFDEFQIDLLERVCVNEAMSKSVTTVTEGTSSNEVMKVVAQTGFNGFPVVRDGRLVGMVTLSDIIRSDSDETKVGALMSKQLVLAYPDESLDEVLKKMYSHKVGRLPVVDRADPSKLVGIISKKDLMKGHEIAKAKKAPA